MPSIGHTFPIFTQTYSKIIPENGEVHDKMFPERLYKIKSEDKSYEILSGEKYKSMDTEKWIRTLDKLPHDCFWIEGNRFGFIVAAKNEQLKSFVGYDFGGESRGFIVATSQLGTGVERNSVKKGGKYDKVFQFSDRTVSFECRRGNEVVVISQTKKQIMLMTSWYALLAAMMDDVFKQGPDTVMSISPLCPDRPIYAEYKGDLEQVRREWKNTQEYNHASDAERAEILIRRRDHGVRGHWRRLRNGEKIWIEPHRRGDVSLGTVTTHIEKRI